MNFPAPFVLYEPSTPPTINRNEVLRCLGYGNNPPDAMVSELINRCIAELSAVIIPRCIYVSFQIKKEENFISLVGGDIKLKGKDIAAHLKNCHTAVLMAATLSDPADRLIRLEQCRDMTSGLITDSCATAAVEQLCDDVESIIKKGFPNSFFTTRYSPGYGDFSLDIQQDFLNVLDAPRRIGLCVTESCILTPRKSVTAIIGVSNKPNANSKTGCENCVIRNSCKFKKRGEFCGLSKPAEN